MCGRYTLKNPSDVVAAYRAATAALAKVGARYNAAPTQLLPILRTEAGATTCELMRWGLVPFWDKSEKPKLAPINARAEEALGKATFKQSLQQRRCLVLSDGFFEWQKQDPEGKVKVPFHIQLRGGAAFTFAGFYEPATETRPATFAFLTTRPNEIMEPIHNRMPVILRREAEEAWLAPGPLDAGALARFAQPYSAAEMEAFPVHRLVGNPRNDVPECVAPLPRAEPEPDLFGGPNSA